MTFKSGFVSIVGRPNVGKSTLVNKLIGEKISIISDKAQTTRNKIQLIYTDEDSQIIFLDTPGLQKPKNELGEYMLEASTSSLEDVDLILMMVEAGPILGRLDKMVLEEVKKHPSPKLLLINKIDLVGEEDLAENLEAYGQMGIFQEIIPISAQEDEDLGRVIKAIKSYLPEGPLYYPEDMITDQAERDIIGEIIREKVLLNMDEEIPHGVAVEVLEFKKREDRDLLDISANIHVEKKSHKPMLIGKGGKMIGRIGSQARQEIELLMDSKVNLQLWVKVSKDWREKEDRVKSFGYK